MPSSSTAPQAPAASGSPVVGAVVPGASRIRHSTITVDVAAVRAARNTLALRMMLPGGSPLLTSTCRPFPHSGVGPALRATKPATAPLAPLGPFAPAAPVAPVAPVAPATLQIGRASCRERG